MNLFRKARAKTESAESNLRKAIIFEICIVIFLIFLSVLPIVLFHRGIWNLYTFIKFESAEVAAYTTAVYISFLLSFKMFKDGMADRFHTQSEFLTYSARQINHRADMETGTVGLPGEEIATSRHRQSIIRSMIRLTRYFAIFISYLFISVSYLYVHKVVV